jgi:hypothetical protein
VLPDIIFARETDSPAAGTYVISNKVNSSDGEQLAITHNDQDYGDAAVVTPASPGLPSQQWIIADEMGGQSLKPVSDSTLKASWGVAGVSVVPSGDYVWTVRKTDDGYTIQDGKATVFWGLESATPTAQVTIGAGTGDDTQIWMFEKVG